MKVSTPRVADSWGGHAESELGTDSKATSIWNALNQLRIPASLPSGAVLAISVEDPRVSFPPLSVNKTMRARNQGKPSPAQIAQQARTSLLSSLSLIFAFYLLRGCVAGVFGGPILDADFFLYVGASLDADLGERVALGSRRVVVVG